MVYIKENKGEKDNFEERARPCVFLGYPPRKKGYRVYDLKEKKIGVSRGVKFVECQYPFRDTHPYTLETNNGSSSPDLWLTPTDK